MLLNTAPTHSPWVVVRKVCIVLRIICLFFFCTSYAGNVVLIGGVEEERYPRSCRVSVGMSSSATEVGPPSPKGGGRGVYRLVSLN